MISQQTIPCPSCRTNIPFDTHELLLGVQFVCPNCRAVIGLAPESREKVQETIDKFDEIKRNVLNSKSNL